MTTRLSIGDFSRMTYLSAKALRHYHEQGVLEPAEVEPTTAYRYYSPSQVGPAQTVRRLRDLGMPLDDVREVLRAPDPDARAATLVAHLRRMERRLEETQQTVASLRTLLSESPAPPAVQRREIPATRAPAVVEHVRAYDAGAWWMDVFTRLHGLARGRRSGSDGALFSRAFFEDEKGELTAFVPVSRPPVTPLPAQVRDLVVPGITAAVAVHDGPFGDLDRTYGALGTWVLDRAAGADGPIREYHLPTGDPNDLLEHRTEVAWPVAA